jgi:hypothetical protein
VSTKLGESPSTNCQCKVCLSRTKTSGPAAAKRRSPSLVREVTSLFIIDKFPPEVLDKKKKRLFLEILYRILAKRFFLIVPYPRV